MPCKCPCHSNPHARHIVACCERPSAAVSLRNIVEASVGQALELSRLADEAEREKMRQDRLEAAIDSSVGASDDRDKLELEADPTGAPTRGGSLDVPTGQQQEPPPEQARQSQTAKPEDVDSDAVIDKFNIIRSGRSMNDRDISAAMKKMIDGMKPEQRMAIFSVLSQIGKIVAPTVDSSRLTKPPEEPTAVQAARLDMLQKRRQDRESSAQKRANDVSTAVVDKQAPQRAPETPPPAEPEERGVEDTSPPIRVGKRTAEGLRAKMKQLLQD